MARQKRMNMSYFGVLLVVSVLAACTLALAAGEDSSEEAYSRYFVYVHLLNDAVVPNP